MQKLRSDQHHCARVVFHPLAEVHVGLDALLAGTTKGEIWVDNHVNPQVGLAMSAGGSCYLAGAAGRRASYAALKALIPHRAYLYLDSPSWEAVLNDVWDNPVARPHHRQLFHYRQPSLATGPVRIPDGFQRVAIDTALLTRTALQHCQAIADQVNDEWGADQFSQHGFGVCLIHDQTIASHCLADYGVGTRCEVGVGTDPGYRRQGLAGLVVAAAVQAGLARGFDHIGWHCLRSNAGSRAIAEHAGFVKVAEYYGYGSGLPAENATDLTSAEWAAWAEHYEQARTRFPHYTYHAAGAWALAGDTDRACDHIHHLVEHEPNARAAWFAGWWFESLHATAAFKALQATLRQRE